MTTTATEAREATLVADSHVVLEGAGVPVRRALPSAIATYDLVDPFLLLDDAQIPTEMSGEGFPPHPHRGFEIITYLLAGSMNHVVDDDEPSQVQAGGLLRITAGRGMWHGEGPGERSAEPMRGIQLWVNLPRAEKQVDPSYDIIAPEDIPERQEGDAKVRVLVGEGSPAQLRTPAMYLDVSLQTGGSYSTSVPSEFQGLAFVMAGEAHFGANATKAAAGQLVVMGPGSSIQVSDATPDTQLILLAGQPHGEVPRWRGPYVD
ncbi:MAG: Pirin domain-containing protein [Dehalococcoidia bacterium]|nr:Pirin domain-containing protein [Dehalococcoidia bacterium]